MTAPDVVLSVLSLSLDTKVALEVPDVEGGYWLTMVAQLENRSDVELPMSFVLFRLTARRRHGDPCLAR